MSCAEANSARYASRSIGGSPAPRSRRVGNVSASMEAPVALTTRLAASRPSARSACPPRRKPQGSPERRALATTSTVSASTGEGGRGGMGSATWPPADQLTSAGRIRVATWPGGPEATATASAASRPMSAGFCDHRTHGDTLRATVSMSLSSWASYCLW